jgi:acetyl-CoA carboxylase biotin carboxyl carrier protein
MAKLQLKSEVTGSVWQIKVKVGDKVAAGDVLVIVESMKMEIPVMSEDGGTVIEILVKEGESVTDGQTVAILEE